MRFSRIPAGQQPGWASIFAALLIGGAGTAAATNTAGFATTTAEAHILPSERPIALIEGLDPENAGVTFVLMPPDTETARSERVAGKINMCVACSGLA